MTGSRDNTIQLWDVSSAATIYRLDNHTDWVNSVVFSESGTHIASGSDDQTVRIWDAKTGQEFKKLTGHNGYVHSVAFSPRGGLVVSGSDDETVRVWEVHTGQEVTRLTRHSMPVTSVSFSSDGSYITSVDTYSNVHAWIAPEDFPLDNGTSEHVLLPATPIFKFDAESGWISRQRDPQDTPERVFYIIPQLQPAKSNWREPPRIWTRGHKVMFQAESGAVTIINFSGSL